MEKEVTLEELEALKAKIVEYENIVNKNKEQEKELEDLKKQRMALEEKNQLKGESRGK